MAFSIFTLILSGPLKCTFSPVMITGLHGLTIDPPGEISKVRNEPNYIREYKIIQR